MMDEIKELDDKYILIKIKDAEKYLNDHDQEVLNRLLRAIRDGRYFDGKQRSNKYVVLNLEDKINVGYLLENIPDSSEAEYEEFNLPVKDMSVILINSILAATETHK